MVERLCGWGDYRSHLNDLVLHKQFAEDQVTTASQEWQGEEKGKSSSNTLAPPSHLDGADG
eukprot:6183078-Pleurochrysis_carterae.AAC.1